jgi:hypothetical protein
MQIAKGYKQKRRLAGPEPPDIADRERSRRRCPEPALPGGEHGDEAA